jgi:hypothetical protein
MRVAFSMLVIVVCVCAVSARADELAVDEPLNANARQNIRPIDELVVDRAHDLFADARVRVVDANGALARPTNAKTRAASRPATSAATAPAPATAPAAR